MACFATAAAHLEPGGFYVVEVGVPDLRRLPPGDDARVFSHGPGILRLRPLHRPGGPAGDIASLHRDGSGVREVTMPFRFVWPSELDLMGRLAGLSLHDRWADWNRARFTGDSTSHVSVWMKTDH